MNICYDIIREAYDPSVKKEAERLVYLINEEKVEKLSEDLPNLTQFVEKLSDVKLHNYAVSISHRIQPPAIDMEIIRSWEILENLLNYAIIVQQIPEIVWGIPDGWKKI